MNPWSKLKLLPATWEPGLKSPRCFLILQDYKTNLCSHFRPKLLKNENFFQKMIINEISDFCRQYQYLQLEKPSGVEVEISVHKTLAMDLLKRGAGVLQNPARSDGVYVTCLISIIIVQKINISTIGNFLIFFLGFQTLCFLSKSQVLFGRISKPPFQKSSESSNNFLTKREFDLGTIGFPDRYYTSVLWPYTFN